MRKDVTKPYAVRKGDLVVISMRLRRSQSDARLSLWSALDGDEMSPHIQQDMSGVLVHGKPQMLPATYMRLTVFVRKTTWKFVADDKLTFKVIQDVDSKDEQLARVRIRAYGPVGQTVRRFVQDTIGRYWRRSKARSQAPA